MSGSGVGGWEGGGCVGGRVGAGGWASQRRAPPAIRPQTVVLCSQQMTGMYTRPLAAACHLTNSDQCSPVGQQTL